MNSIVVFLGVIAILMRSMEASSIAKLTVASGSMEKRIKAFQQLHGKHNAKSSGSLDGADPEGIFQHCTCTSDANVNCVCEGNIATGVLASMEMNYHPQTATADTVIKCNGDFFFGEGDLNPDTGVTYCTLEKLCGGADVKMCFRFYHMTNAVDEDAAPHGCNDVTVTINGGKDTVYTECMPGKA